MEAMNIHNGVKNGEKIRSFVSIGQFAWTIISTIVTVAIAITVIASKASNNKEQIIEIKSDAREFRKEALDNQREILTKLDKLNDKLDKKKDK